MLLDSVPDVDVRTLSLQAVVGDAVDDDSDTGVPVAELLAETEKFPVALTDEVAEFEMDDVGVVVEDPLARTDGDTVREAIEDGVNETVEVPLAVAKLPVIVGRTAVGVTDRVVADVGLTDIDALVVRDISVLCVTVEVIETDAVVVGVLL